MLYLEDLAIGDHFQSREYEMTLPEILKFAEQYDPQVFHTDVEKAKEHPIFQGIFCRNYRMTFNECFLCILV